MTIGSGANEREIAVFGQHGEILASEQDLAVAVASTFPFELARSGIDRRKDPLIKAVDHALVQHGSGESILHPGIAPDLPHRESAAISGQFDHRGPGAVARRYEHA